MSGIAEKLYVVLAVVLALTTAVMAYGIYGPSAEAQPKDDAGCVVGNPSPGSECQGGNTGKPGGGVGCAGGSNAPRSEPCGRAGDDGTLNSKGNVPGCTSQGNAVNQNPHCAQYGGQYGGPL